MPMVRLLAIATMMDRFEDGDMGIGLGVLVVSHWDLRCVCNESRHFVGIFDGIVNFFSMKVAYPDIVSGLLS